MKNIQAILITGLIFALGACASPYTPSPDLKFETIEEFTTEAVLTLLNSQPSVEEIKIGGQMIANYNEWTAVAIEIAERELAKRGARIRPGAGKTLSLAITKAKYSKGWVMISTDIELHVETGDGHVSLYTGHNGAAMVAVPNQQVDGAMMRVVKEMLMDPAIIEYLRK